MFPEIEGRVSEFWNRLQDFEHWPPPYFLMSNTIHHNINYVILLASICYWLLSEERRRPDSECRMTSDPPEAFSGRSEERRVGKECRCRWSRCHARRNKKNVGE